MAALKKALQALGVLAKSRTDEHGNVTVLGVRFVIDGQVLEIE